MTTVIATGCPHSDWEKVLPILQLSGLESAGDTFAKWYDELFRPVEISDPLQVDHPWQPGPNKGESVATLLPAAPTGPVLLADSRSLWLLDFWAARLPQAQFLLFYTHAESAVAHACAQGIDPHQFLEGWQVANRQLLRFQRCHRRQAILLDAEAAVRHPRELIEACRRFDLPLQTPPELPSSNPHVASVEHLLARYLVSERPEVKTLQTELEATAQPLGDNNIPVEQIQTVELVCSYLQHQAYERNLRQALNETDEKLQIAEQVQKEQTAKIEQLTEAVDEQTKLSTAYQSQLEQLQHQLQERNTAIVSLQEELNSRQDEIGRHQWYLGERDAEIVRFNDNLAAQGDELNRKQHELDKQHESAQRQQQEYLAEIDALKTILAQKVEENVYLNRLLSERDVVLCEIEQSLEVRDEEMAMLTAERQAQLDEKFKAAADLESQLTQITKTKDELARTAEEQQQAMASLVWKKNELAKQTSELQAQIKQLAQARDEQAKIAAKRLTQIEQAQQAHKTLQSDNKEAVRENELLLLQLHQVQEELEDIYLRSQNLKQAYERSETDNKQATQENDRMSRELRQFEKELLAKDREIETQRQRLTRLKETVSWKITAPFRAVTKPFRKSPKKQKQTTEEVKLVKTSGLFDEAWYLAENEDVAKEGADPVEHFIRHGATEGRNPSPVFDLRQYLEINPDVADAGMNPFIHFVKFGRAERRSVSC